MVIATSISKTKLSSQDAGAINFETKWSYNLQVVVKDVVKYPLSTVGLITVITIDVNEAPIQDAVELKMLESDAVGSRVGDPLLTEDPDTPDDTTDDGHTFSMMDENGIFAITANGQVSFTNGAVNFESQSSYTVTVKVTDNGTPPMETVQDVTVSVRNTNDAPTLEESGKNTTQRNHSEPHTS